MASDIKPSACPNCYTLLFKASHMRDDEKRPGPGDVNVCLECATVLVFNDDLSVHLPLAGEISDPGMRAEIAKHVDAIKAVKGLA